MWIKAKLVLLHQILPFEMQELPWVQYFHAASTKMKETERSGTNLHNVLQSSERIVLIWTHYKKRNSTIWHSKRKINKKKNPYLLTGTFWNAVHPGNTSSHYLFKQKQKISGWKQDLPNAEHLRYQIKNYAWIKILESLGKNYLILVRFLHEVTKV